MSVIVSGLRDLTICYPNADYQYHQLYEEEMHSRNEEFRSTHQQRLSLHQEAIRFCPIVDE